MNGIDPIALALIGGLMAGLVVVAAALLRIWTERTSTTQSVVVRRPGADQRTRRLDEALGHSAVLRRAVEVTADLAARRGVLGRVERQLRAADVPVRPAELILGHLAAVAAVAPLVWLLTRSMPLVVGSLTLSLVGTPLVLRFLVRRRLNRFERQLPDALTSLSGSLRAGRSIGQAMEALSREMRDPMGRELRKVVAEVRLGRSLHETLTDAAERVGSDDFRWAVLAMQIQSEVGGNLAELLDHVAATMRERSRMRGEVKALTAEGRASAMMLVVMVPALGGVMAIMNWAYMEPLFTTPTGRILLGVSATMIAGGYAWMNSMVKIDV